MERVTIHCSNLFGLDDYIKQYLLEHPDITFGTQLKIILKKLITDDLILQINALKKYLNINSFSHFTKSTTFSSELG